MTITEAEKVLEEAEFDLRKAEEAVSAAKYALWDLVNGQEGMPQEDGWYLDANDNPAHRQAGIWDDGWGNGGPAYGYPATPLRKLTVVDGRTSSSNEIG